MYRMKDLAPIIGIAALVVVGVACTGSAAAPGDSTVQPVVETGGSTEPQPTVAPALDTDQFDLPGVLVQYDSEPNSPPLERLQPFGRVPRFTLLEDGTLIYVDSGRRYDERRVMEVRLSGDDADALMQQVLDLGFERLGNYAEQCEDLGDGAKHCITHASYTVLRVRLPSGEPRQVRIYANFGSDPKALEAIRSLLGVYSHPDARPYVPVKATLFIRPIAEAVDVPVLDWELDPAWLEAGDGTGRQWARVVDRDALATLLASVPRNVGDFFFQHEGQAYHTTLVPRLPSVDYTADVAAYRGPG